MSDLEYLCSGDDERVLKNNAQRAKACPEIYRFGVSREHYIWLADQIFRMRAALTKIQYLEASDADTWIWQAQETAREALTHGQSVSEELER